jgi:hypothetical protein
MILIRKWKNLLTFFQYTGSGLTKLTNSPRTFHSFLPLPSCFAKDNGSVQEIEHRLTKGFHWFLKVLYFTDPTRKVAECRVMLHLLFVELGGPLCKPILALFDIFILHRWLFTNIAMAVNSKLRTSSGLCGPQTA